MKIYLARIIIIISLILIPIASSAKNNSKVLKDIFVKFSKGVVLEYANEQGRELARTNINNTHRDISANLVPIQSVSSVIRNTLYEWNQAMNDRDTNTLHSLYASRVLYYGSEFVDTKCIKDKKRFYRKYPLFSQSIENASITQISDTLFKVNFDKYVKLKESKPMKIYPSYLVIDITYNTPFIVVEGDSITDRVLLKRRMNR